MNEEIHLYMWSSTKKAGWTGPVDHLIKALHKKLEPGKATLLLLSKCNGRIYGSQTPLSKVANVQPQNAKNWTDAAWEKKDASRNWKKPFPN